MRWALIGTAAAVGVLGVSGNLEAVTPVDRMLNPDARHYWQSEEEYVREIIDSCSERAFVPGGGKARAADACVDSSLRSAVERDYLPAEWLP